MSTPVRWVAAAALALVATMATQLARPGGEPASRPARDTFAYKGGSTAADQQLFQAAVTVARPEAQRLDRARGRPGGGVLRGRRARQRAGRHADLGRRRVPRRHRRGRRWRPAVSARSSASCCTSSATWSTTRCSPRPCGAAALDLHFPARYLPAEGLRRPRRALRGDVRQVVARGHRRVPVRRLRRPAAGRHARSLGRAAGRMDGWPDADPRVRGGRCGVKAPYCPRRRNRLDNCAGRALRSDPSGSSWRTTTRWWSGY